MFKRLIAVSIGLFSLSGCMYQQEPMPEITSTTDYMKFGGAQKEKFAPKVPEISTEGINNIPQTWFPPRNAEKKWTAIIIHHSATKSGNSAIFDKWHKESKHWNGVGYDFVIGNGTDSFDGQVEVTYRWKEQKTGAHCGGTPGNWANVDGIGICLVGDFSKAPPTGREMQSLVKLVRFLQSRYNIPKSRIYGHSNTPGYTGGSVCPGRYFNMQELKSSLDF